MFQKFDGKGLYYIEAKDIRTFLEQINKEVPQYLDLVIQKEFQYELINFQ